MMRRFSWVALAILAVLAIPMVAHADTIRLTDYSGTDANFNVNAAGGGGAFTAYTIGTGLLGNSSFMTFCIEYNEHYSYGTTYNYTLSNSAVNGGVAGGNPDPVSDATKWLYYQAVSGLYKGWWGLGSFGSITNAGATFQYAIWLLENEVTSTTSAGTSLATKATAAAAAGGWIDLEAAGVRVYAANLTTGTGGNMVQNQSQLAYTVPEPTSMMLFVIGLVGLASVITRQKRQQGSLVGTPVP